MKARGKIISVVTGLWLAVAPISLAQAEQSVVTNSPATITTPATPPLPAPLRLPINAQQITNRLQRLQAIQAGSNLPLAAPVTSFTASPGQPPSAALAVLTNRPVQPMLQPLPLVADADVKEYTAKPGETNAQFTFTVSVLVPVAPLT